MEKWQEQCHFCRRSFARREILHQHMKRHCFIDDAVTTDDSRSEKIAINIPNTLPCIKFTWNAGPTEYTTPHHAEGLELLPFNSLLQYCKQSQPAIPSEKNLFLVQEPATLSTGVFWSHVYPDTKHMHSSPTKASSPDSTKEREEDALNSLNNNVTLEPLNNSQNQALENSKLTHNTRSK